MQFEQQIGVASEAGRALREHGPSIPPARHRRFAMRYGAQMCGLRLGRRSGPVSSPRVAFLGLAAALVIACGGGSGEPAATPPTETPGSTRSPVAAGGPVTPTPAPDAFAIEISEVEKAFVRLESAPGERIKETAGLFFLDVATGEVEGWQLLGQGSGWFQLFTSPRNRYVYAPDGPPGNLREPLLLDRRTGRSFTWDPRELKPALSEVALVVVGERLIFERLGSAVGENSRLFVVFDSTMEPTTWFDLPSAGPGAGFWPDRDGRHLLAFIDTTYYVIDLRQDPTVPIALPIELGVRVSLFGRGDGFAAIDIAGSKDDDAGDCRVTRYDWDAVVLSPISVGCADSSLGARAVLSPDGSLIAVATAIHGASGPGLNPALTQLAMFDAVTGEELFRAHGVVLPYRGDVSAGTSWLADSSGLVVDTTQGQQILSAAGQWIPAPAALLANESRLVPAPDDPSRFAVAATTVVDGRGEVLASLRSVEYPGHVLPWGANSRELRFFLPHGGHDGAAVIPLLPPVIEWPPFTDRLAVEVVVDGCLNLRVEPTTLSEIVTCLLDGALLDPTPGSLTGPEPPTT